MLKIEEECNAFGSENMASLLQSIGNDPLDPSRLTLSNGIHQGEFYVGPQIPAVNAPPVRNIVEFLAKRDDSGDEFVTLKMLMLSQEGESSEDGQGKVLLHNEHLILSLLQDQPGVIHHHGLFKDRKHFILVLDCLVAHNYDCDGKYKDLVNLQRYVIKEKRLKEREALELFCTVLTTVKTLHKKNIVHKDLKLGNMVLNTRTREVILINFALSKHLVRDDYPLTDQRGSLAYISPDVLSGKPYDGKASDMWAMGVLLYTMLYGQFPFYDNDPQELFRKIKTADYTLPTDGRVSKGTSLLIRQLIELDATKRLTATRALETAQSILSRLSVITDSELSYAQIVPDVDRCKPQDCTVPDQQEEDSAVAMETNQASNIEMNAVRLTLSPILLGEAHRGHMIHPIESHGGHVFASSSGLGAGPISVSPPVAISPTLQGAGHFTPYTLTEIPPVHLPYPRPSQSTGNPFIHTCSSASPTFFSASPANSLGPSSPTTSFGGINMIPLTSTSHSFPPPSLICHRYPLTLSLSNDSYFYSPLSPHTHPSSTQSQVHTHPTSTQSQAHSHSTITQPHIHTHPTLAQPPMYSHSYPLSYMHSPHSIGYREDSRNSSRIVISSQSVLDSLVTVRTVSSNMQSSNRHSYPEGQRLNISPRQRRNSSGSEQRRRHSHHTYGNGSSVLSADTTSFRRHRRRSHDERDQQADILESLRNVATRRPSQTQCIPIRVFGPADASNIHTQQPS